MTVVTRKFADIAKRPDYYTFEFETGLRRSNDDEDLSITPRRVKVDPEEVLNEDTDEIEAVLSVELDPGPCRVTYRGTSHIIEIPDEGPADLQDLIDAGTVENSRPEIPSNSVALRGYPSRYVPITSGPDAGKYRTVYGPDDLQYGEPVELTDVIPESIAEAAAEAVTPGIVTADIEGRDPTVVDLGGGQGRIEIGGAHGSSFSWPANGWSGITGKPDITYVSRFVPLHGTFEDAIEAAVAEASGKPGGVVDFEGLHYVTTATVSVSADAVTLANGGIVPTGQFPALSVSGEGVTVRDMTFSRSQSAGVADSLEQRSCVTVSGEKFRSYDCSYLAANQACVYLSHGVCDGAVIRGGSMTGTSARQNACGVYAASGSVGNNDITVQNVFIHDTTEGILLFDTGSSLIQGNRVEHLRKLPDVTLTGWALVSGNIWRQRTASGSNPGVDGVSTDREDGNTRTITVDGVSFGDISPYGSSPGTNQAGISGGYVYINLGGTDPNTKTIVSGILSGYAYAIYVTGTTGVNEPLMRYNRFVDNHATDCDGFGIYFQFANYVGSFGNHAVNNTLKNVCLEGVQLLSLPFAGIGVVGGADTLIMGNTIDGVGAPGKTAPGIDVMPGISGNVPSGKIVGTTVRNGSSHGFQIRASGWTLTSCHAHGNAASGFRVWSNTASAVVRNVTLNGCHASYNGTAGFFLDGTSAAISYISASIIGGSAYNNTFWNVVFYAHASNANIRDSAVIGMELRDNGASYPQIQVRGVCQRALIDGNRTTSASSGAIGLQVEASTVDTVVGNNQYSLATPETLLAPVRMGGTVGAFRGTGTPEGVVAAAIGSTFQRSDGSLGTALYVKESGTGNTGWVPKGTVRVGTVASIATPTINTNNVDQFNITALAGPITSMTTNLSGTPVDGQRLRIRFKDNGTGRSITWGASFTGNLLSTTVANKTHVQELVYDAAAGKWAGTFVDTAGY